MASAFLLPTPEGDPVVAGGTAADPGISLSYRVIYFGSGVANGGVDSSLVTVGILPGDTTNAIRTKMGYAVIAEATRLGYAVARTAVVLPGVGKG